jgi:hypothetical protein
LQVPEEQLGRSVRCGRCDTVFTATARAEGESDPHVQPETPRRGAESIARSPSRVDEEDEFDDRYYDIRRRGRYSRVEARSKVIGPAILLQVYGGLLFLSAFLGIFGVIYAVTELGRGGKNPGGMKEDDAIMLIICSILGMVGGFLFGPIIFVGGYRMQRLRSWGLALTATVLTFVFGGLTCLPLMLVGIWPLVVLVDSDVKRGFHQEAEKGAI